MGLDMYLSYRRNLDGIPETIQVAMRKQAFIDTWPHLAKYYIKDNKLDAVINEDIEAGKPYEEQIMYWRKANAIHKFFVDNCANGVDDCEPVQVTIDALKDLVERCEEILKSVKSGPDDDELIIDADIADELLPAQSGFFFGSTDYDDWYIDDLKETVKALKPIVEHPEFYTDPIIYEASW